MLSISPSIGYGSQLNQLILGDYEMEVVFSVYSITNCTNGDQYIGFSRQPFERWKTHVRDANKSPQYRLSRAIRKYGKENFEFKILNNFTSKKEAMNEEIRLIAQNKPAYNLTLGGESGSPRLGMKNSPEMRAKISVALKGRKRSIEQVANTSRALKLYYTTHPGPMSGKTHSIKSREKLSVATRERLIRDGNPFQGKKHTIESRQRISNSVRQVWATIPHPMKGKEHSQDTKIKMSESTKRRLAR